MVCLTHPSLHFKKIGKYRAVRVGRDPSLFSGHLPPGVKGFVIEWATIHQQELIDDWERAQTQQDL
jgi:hypothetical protein